MPEKEGDDEKKSTKSVVNKKQKQMMGEEGYDIARDMGKVKPSKDKKDATTMPVSDEVKKTQKVNKGPSAFERVKAKYGKSVMNVGKKKANEELDLTQVAEAFGGYVVEGKVEDEKKKADAKFKKDFAGPLSRGTVTQKALPLYKAGGPFVPDKTVDKTTGEKVKPMEKKPYMGKATVPGTSKKEPIPDDTGAGDPKEVKKTKKKFSDFSKKIQSLKKDQGKAKQAVVDVETDKFFKDVEKRKQSGFDNLRKAVQTGRTKSGEDASKIGTRDISTMNPSEREKAFGSSGSTEGGAGGEGPKRQDQLSLFKQTPSAKKAGEQASKEAQSASSQLDPSQKDFASRKRGESSAVVNNKTFKQFKNEVPLSPTEVVTGPTKVDGKITTPKTKKEKPTITRGKARKDKGFTTPVSKGGGIATPTPTEKSLIGKSRMAKAVIKSTEFVKKNPAAAAAAGGLTGIAAYDLGKGILSKIMNLRTPSVQGGKAIQVSARQ